VLAALLPDRRTILTGFRPARPVAALAAAAAVPFVVYGIHMARNYADGKPPYDSHVGLDQWTGLAAMAFGLPLAALCGRIGALSAAAGAAVFAIGSLVYPHKPGSAGVLWGLAALVWAGALVATAGPGPRPETAGARRQTTG
jgi:hypothetical protein